MEKFKEYARLAWSSYKSVATNHPVWFPVVPLVFGFALGYWVG